MIKRVIDVSSQPCHLRTSQGQLLLIRRTEAHEGGAKKIGGEETISAIPLEDLGLVMIDHSCERRLKSAARGGRKVQRWGWVWNLLRQVICSKDRSVRPSVPLVVAVSGHL